MIDRDAARKALGRDMGNGEFACALSHHFIYREIIARNLAHALVLEDDAILGQEFLQFLEHGKKRDVDLLVLDHRRADVFRAGSLHFPSGQTAYRLAFSPFLTTGYIVSNAGARTLLNNSLPIAAPADWPINIADMKSFAIDPRVVDHPDAEKGSSHIRTERTPARRKKQSASRLLTAVYWKKKYRKIASNRIS
jgi:glycosyl transferase family 25